MINEAYYFALSGVTPFFVSLFAMLDFGVLLTISGHDDESSKYFIDA